MQEKTFLIGVWRLESTTQSLQDLIFLKESLIMAIVILILHSNNFWDFFIQYLNRQNLLSEKGVLGANLAITKYVKSLQELNLSFG